MIQKLAMFALVMLASSVAFAAEGTSDMRYLGVAFGIGAAVLGGALGQAKVAAAALESIGRNPSAAGALQTPMILGLAFVESLVLFAWVLLGFIVA
ncbi:MAG: ATP synthase F0 subunit C [Myxococcota bacterium]|nr:ATP synthase F0 subunit C [Myxococcota bacterium]